MARNFSAHEARMRLARHYVEVVCDANTIYLQGGDNSLAALASFDAECPQIWQWWGWLSALADQHDEAAALLVTMVQGGHVLLAMRLTPAEQLQWHQGALQAAQRMSNTEATALHLRCIGSAYVNLGDVEQATEFYRQSCQWAEQYGHEQLLADGWFQQSLLLEDLGNLEAADLLTQQALERYRQLGDSRGRGNCLGLLGWIAIRRGEWNTAESYLQEAYDISLQLGDQMQLAQILQRFGLLAAHTGNYPQSVIYRTQTLEFATRLGDQMRVIIIIMDLATLDDNQGDFAAAQERYLQALGIAKRIGAQRFEGVLLGNLGYSAYLQGNFADAIRYTEDSLRLLRVQKLTYLVGYGLANIIPCYLSLGLYEEARLALRDGLELAVAIGAEPLKATMVVAAIQIWVASAQAQTELTAQLEMMEFAAYWSGLILICPGAEQENRDEVDKLRPQMESVLGGERFTELLKQGGQIFIDELIPQILAVL